MSLFISTENQQLIYGMIHKTPEINVFKNTEDKNQWFRSIIEQFSTQLPPTITRDKLKEVNREVLSFMMNSLRSLSNQRNTTTPPSIPPQRLLKREQSLEPREYTTFYDLPKPKIIDFSEKIEDPIITNMEELIEQQKKMRERELQEYAPPPPLATETQSNIRMTILEELPKTVLQPIEKHVQFEDPSLTIMTRLIESIDRLNTRMGTLEGKLEEFSSRPVAVERIHNTLEGPVQFLKNLITENVV